jgi:hypothetical protein
LLLLSRVLPVLLATPKRWEGSGVSFMNTICLKVVYY